MSHAFCISCLTTIQGVLLRLLPAGLNKSLWSVAQSTTPVGRVSDLQRYINLERFSNKKSFARGLSQDFTSFSPNMFCRPWSETCSYYRLMHFLLVFSLPLTDVQWVQIHGPAHSHSQLWPCEQTIHLPAEFYKTYTHFLWHIILPNFLLVKLTS